MDLERLNRIEEIHFAVLQLPSNRRDSFLSEACGSDDDLRREVESLLAFENGPGSFLDSPPEALAAEMFAEVQASSLIGREVGHYKIIELLGAGGMGEVFLAEDTRLDRRVALKCLPSKFAADRDRMSRFRREAKTASALNHPNIITIHEINEYDGVNFIATEYIVGKTLKELLKADPPNLTSALEIAVQIVSALNEAHAAGIVHRDVKPDNVMIRPNGLVKVLDFGISKLLENEGCENRQKVSYRGLARTGSSTTNPGMILGTANYMSPEQARGGKVDARTDIFSFGIVLYEMLSGKLPFDGDSAIDTIGAILHKEPPPIGEFSPTLPQDVEYIVNRSLCKNRDERYQTTGDLLADLQRVKNRLDRDGSGGVFERGHPTYDPENAETRILGSSDPARIFAIQEPPPNNLAGEVRPLIGRDAETKEVLELMRQAEPRVLTITGVGGTGKTRLARTVSHLSLREFSDGVYYIGLAPIDDHELVVPIIAQTLDIREKDGRSLSESVREHLRDKKLLLVLDNFEQVIGAAAAVGELLVGSGYLKILVTSRVRLNIDLESEYKLQPLGVPADEKRLTINELARFPAMQLFIRRARTARSDFVLTPENAGAVAAICRRLDGLPLAIELAAVRVKLFAPKAILKRLESTLDLLSGGARDLPERQQTMRGAIRWSYDLLGQDETKLFDRLSVFRGGFTLEGAAAVGNAVGDLSVDLLDVISSLVDKSLMSQREQSDGEPRFRMLIVVREFAAEKLEKSGEQHEIKKRHAAFYSALCEAAEPDLLGAKAAGWMDVIELEHDNLRSTLEWTLDNEPVAALAIVGIIYRFWLRRGYTTEGRRWLAAALQRSGAKADATLRAKAARGGGLMSLQQGDLEAANRLIGESLSLSREIGDRSLICYALTSLGAIRVGEGDLETAGELTRECLDIAREINDRFQIAVSLNRLGDIARQNEDHHAAWNYTEEACTIARQDSISAALPIFTHNLASIACLLNDLPAAYQYNLESLKYGEELGHKTSMGSALSVFGALAMQDGKAGRAAKLFGAVQAIFEANAYNQENADKKFHDYYVFKAKAAIGDDAFDAAFAEGRLLSISDAVALARQNESKLPNF